MGEPLIKAVLVANGVLEPGAMQRLILDAKTCDLLIGVDGGARHLRALALRPDVVTGDFDSLTPAELDEFKAHGAQIVPTPDQNYTDLDKALELVFGSNIEIRIYGGTGARLDHEYSVLSAVIKHGRSPGCDVRLVDDVGETWLAAPYALLEGKDLPGRTLSLMAFGPVTGVTLTGVRWPLNNELLMSGVRDGTLNEITDTRVTLRVGSGDLLVMLHHAAPPAATNDR